MGRLYHGSTNDNIEVLEPRESTHGKYVYATPYKEIAVVFSAKAGDDLTFSFFRNNQDGPWQLVERVPKAFDAMFNTKSFLYTVNDETFKDIHTGFAEVVSEVPVPTLSKEVIPNLFTKVDELVKEGKIEIYRYPKKHPDLPSNDIDLLNGELKRAKRKKRPVTKEALARLVLLHPNMMDLINEKMADVEGFEPFKKEDLLEIFEVFSKYQRERLDKEMFLQSAYTSLIELYPEFKDKLDSIINKTDLEEKTLKF